MQCSQKGHGTLTDPLEIGNSEADEAESALKPDEADPTHQTKDVPSQSSNPRDTSSASGHRSQLHATDEETRAVAVTLELLQSADDPDNLSLEKMNISKVLVCGTTSAIHRRRGRAIPIKPSSSQQQTHRPVT